MVSLTPTPPANAFVTAADLDREQPRFPLDVFFCDGCAHVQLLDVVDPRALFENYVYVSGTSPTFVRHFEGYSCDMIARANLGPGDLVVDIGSNDGTLLRFFAEAGCRTLGIDPARDIARRATEAGIETIAGVISVELARRIRDERGPAALVTANNVFAHVDDLTEFVAAARTLLAPDGLFAFEVSYLADMVEKVLFDTIYHEHLDYHSVKPLRRFFAMHGMELIEVIRVDAHGGSIRGVAQLAGGGCAAGRSVESMIALEERLGLDRGETFFRFAERIDALKDALSSVLGDLKTEGKRIAGYGAPAKATTLMYHFDLGPEIIDFIVDDSPFKQGLYSPGLHVPVLPPEAIYERRPDCLLVLAWNFAEPIMSKHRDYAEAGGRFIVPAPTIEIY